MAVVLYISRGGQIAGSQRQLFYVLCGLDRRRYEPVVICREEGPFLDLLRRKGIETHLVSLYPWRKWPGAFQRFSDARKLVSFARRRRVRIIHGSDLWQSGYVCNAAHHLRIPSVLHARAPKRPAEVRKHWRREVSAVIAISTRVRANLIAGGVPKDKVSLIYDGVDIDRFHPRLRKLNVLRRQFPQAKGLLIGIVGRICRFKRQLDFLRVAAHMVRHNSTFFVIGKPEDLSYDQEIRRFVQANGLANRVVLTGQRDDMPEVLASLDVLVTLSGGSVMIEAMACGTAVVSAGFTPVEYSTIVQDGRTGLLVASDKAADLEGAITRIIDCPELRDQLSRQARQHAKTMFSHNEMVIATQKIYDRLL